MGQFMSSVISTYIEAAVLMLPAALQQRLLDEEKVFGRLLIAQRQQSYQQSEMKEETETESTSTRMLATTMTPTTTTTTTTIITTTTNLSTLSRPIPNSYWATPLLLACEYPWAPKHPEKPKLDNLLLAGIRTFIDLTESGELLPYCGSILSTRAEVLGIPPSSIEYHRFPIRDRSLPSSPDYMYQVMEVLKDNEKRGRISAVHCRGGIGRTGMVVGCWLVQSGVVSDGKEALSVIAKKWKTVEKCERFPNSPETGPQFEFVMKFRAAKKLSRGASTRRYGYQPTRVVTVA